MINHFPFWVCLCTSIQHCPNIFFLFAFLLVEVVFSALLYIVRVRVVCISEKHRHSSSSKSSHKKHKERKRRHKDSRRDSSTDDDEDHQHRSTASRHSGRDDSHRKHRDRSFSPVQSQDRDKLLDRALRDRDVRRGRPGSMSPER